MKNILRSSHYELPDGDVVCMQIELRPDELNNLDAVSRQLESLAAVILGGAGQGKLTDKPLTSDQPTAQQSSAHGH